MKRFFSLLMMTCFAFLHAFTPPANPAPPPFIAGLLPVVLVNNSLLPDSQINVVFIGRDPAIPANQVFVNFDTSGIGSLVVATPGDNASNYSQPLSQFPATTDGRVVYIPQLDSGLVFFSVNTPLNMPVNPPHEIVEPSFTNPADPNYNTNFDIFELTYVPTGVNIVADATAVSFFSIPLYGYISTPSPNSSANTGLYQPRNFIFSYAANLFENAPESNQWNNLILKNGLNSLRILSPGKAMTAATPLFDPNYLDNVAAYGYSYISDIWTSPTSYYRLHLLQLTIPDGSFETYTGIINLDNTITFTSTPSGYQVVFAAPTITPFTTTEKIFSGISLVTSDNSPGAADGVQVSKLFQEAIIAGLVPTSNTLSNPYLLANKNNYYTINPNLSPLGQVTGPWYDLYSKVLHSLGFIYTFAFDEPLWPEVQIFSDTLIANQTYLGITIGPLTQAPSSTTLISSSNPALINQPVNFTATVSGTAALGIPTGTITFTIDGIQQSISPLINGQATFQVSNLTVGNHVIEAIYSGDVVYLPSTFLALNQVIVAQEQLTITTLTSTPNPTIAGQTVTLIADVNDSSLLAQPTGTVSFIVDGKVVASVALTNKQAIFQLSNLSIGSYKISAIYSGDTNYQSSISSSIIQVITTTLSIFPPRDLKVVQIKEQFATQIDYVNSITWKSPLTGTIPIFYKIYRDKSLKELVAVVKNNQGILNYKDHNRKKGRPYFYFIISVDGLGNTSNSAEITFQ
jgi:Beta-1,3-glucanase/Bacterial Ig-like domain (group 3)